jgi:DNA-directed RNA polymerase subunit RPC12/RpoP
MKILTNKIELLSLESQVLYSISNGVNNKKKLWNIFESNYRKGEIGKAVNDLLNSKKIKKTDYLVCPHCGKEIIEITNSNSYVITEIGEKYIKLIKEIIGNESQIK